MRFTTARRITVVLGVVLVVVGLAVHTGSGTISSFGWQQIAAICPLGAIETFFAEKMLLPRTVIACVLMIVGVVLLGKVFCAWLCPLPPLRRFLIPQKRREKQAAKLAKEEAEVVAQIKAADSQNAQGASNLVATSACKGISTCNGASEDNASICSGVSKDSANKDSGCGGCASQRKKLDSRHLVLGGALVSTAIFGFPVFCLVCPVGLTFASIIAIWRFVGFSELTWSILVFPAVLLIEILLLRKWWHRFCPLGAFLSLLSIPNKFIKPVVDQNKCIRSLGGSCQICAEVCEEEIDPHFAQGMHECTKCGLCKEKCPAKAISFKFMPSSSSS